MKRKLMFVMVGVTVLFVFVGLRGLRGDEGEVSPDEEGSCFVYPEQWPENPLSGSFGEYPEQTPVSCEDNDDSDGILAFPEQGEDPGDSNDISPVSNLGPIDGAYDEEALDGDGFRELGMQVPCWITEDECTGDYRIPVGHANGSY